jgi:hypothetical protein
MCGSLYSPLFVSCGVVNNLTYKLIISYLDMQYGTKALVSSLTLRDGNGYPKPEYPTSFTRYKGEYGMISLPVGMLMGENLYLSGRRVRV